MKTKTIYCFGIALISLLIIGATQSTLTVFTVGDSTMAPYDTTNNPQRGWGQMLQQFFNSDVAVIDAARGGRSSKSFITEGLWEAVRNQIKPGDYVFIQFAHNDEKTDTVYHTDPWTSYKTYLRKYVQDTRDKGGIPILFTPIVRRYFDASGHITPTGLHNVGTDDSTGNYPRAMKAVAREMNVPIVDLTTKTKELVESYGSEGSSQLYIPTDNTHPNILGASLIAQLAVQGIKEQNIALKQFVDYSSNLVVSPKSFSFGDRFVGTVSQEKSYTISGFNLSPSSGKITVTAPDGFQVSLKSGSNFSQTVDCSYSGGAITSLNIYVRFTPTTAKVYNASINISGGGTASQSISVSGVGIPIASGTRSSAVWNLTTDQNVSSVTGPIFAKNERLVGMEVYNYTTITGSAAGNCQRNRIIGGSWTAEIAQNDKRFIQFEISPQPGFSLNVDSISIYIGAAGGSGMKATISCSTDSNFTSPLLLSSVGMSFVANTVQLFNYSPAIKLNDKQSLYLRIYPWYTAAATGKYICLQNVVISGTASSGASGIKKEIDLPTEFSLSQNYPNPFNPETVISYQISTISHVTLKVYDVLGKDLKTLVDEVKQPGKYSSSFSSASGVQALHSSLSSGIYFYMLQADPLTGSGKSYIEVKKMMLLK